MGAAGLSNGQTVIESRPAPPFRQWVGHYQLQSASCLIKTQWATCLFSGAIGFFKKRFTLLSPFFAGISAMRASTPAAPGLHAAKLSPPLLTPAQVNRAAICDLIRNHRSVKLIVVRAPAGFGKTTAMVQARAQLEADRVDTVWLTLDRADNDASRFLTCLSAAVSRMTGPRFESDTDTNMPLTMSLGDIALDIMEKLARHVSPYVLILDDFESVQDSTVIRLVREIIDNLPRLGQMIIGSRSLPDLGLGRLRAHGQLLEIDINKLRFSPMEATEFLRHRRHLHLLENDISALCRKTEGWVAALWLASMALEKREAHAEFIARFSGSNEAVAAYLAEDVLANQPVEVREFLLKTSILHYLQPASCDTLVPNADSSAMLRRLEASNIFLIRIEGEKDTYRYHSLFAGFLRDQLSREMPEELPRLHCAASHWYDSQGRPVPAIDHALDGKSYEHALALLSRHAESLLEQGRMQLLSRWFSTVPENLLLGSPMMLQVVRIWALCFTSGPWGAMELLERSECATTTDPHVLAYVLALRPMMLLMMDRNEEALAVGQTALSHLPLSAPFPDSVLANEMAYVYSIMGQYCESHKLLDAARRRQGERESTFNRMYSESIEGIINLEAGHLRLATARFKMAVNVSHASSFSHTVGNAWAGVLYADSVYEMNQLEEAEHLLHVYVPFAKDVGLSNHTIIGYIMLSRIAFQRGDIDVAVETLAELEYIGHQRKLRRVVASAKLERSRLLLMQGKEQAAGEELERANDLEVWERVRRLRLLANDLDYFTLAELRWQIFSGRPQQTLPRLEAEIVDASGAMRRRRLIKLQLLRSIALKQSGNLPAAVAAFGEILEITSKEGFIRIIVDEGSHAAQLVRHFVAKMKTSQPERSDPIFDEYIQRLSDGFAQSLITDVSLPNSGSSANEGKQLNTLTAKEIRLLGLLAEGYSNSAMAEKLFVSDSTVRTHLRNINTKLDVHSRTAAVAAARRIGIIH
jgi:LuxR family maltose regulon positive regulatory protein